MRQTLRQPDVGEFEDSNGVRWLASGEPAQVAVGVRRPTFGREDILHFPELVAEEADAIASRRRRSFRWCRCCRRVRPPEWFEGAVRVCEECGSAFERLYAAP